MKFADASIKEDKMNPPVKATNYQAMLEESGIEDSAGTGGS
jgi:hypothetical protein